MSLQVITIGENPNLAFYAWRLQATNSCFVTMVSSGFESSAPIHWDSPLGDSLFTPNILLPSLSHVDPSKKFDIVLLSVSNLQSFQSVCGQLEPLLHSSSLIAVESTGYVQLEPFVLSNFPRAKGLTVCSMMSECDVKRLPDSNNLTHRVHNGDQRIYLGTCTNESKSLNRVSESESYTKLYKLLQKVQAESNGNISLLKSNNYKEFMTYQWKLALPRIVLNPLSVIFEEPYPEDLGKQILAKPLITGLVNELFKIIKKMECKLIKGFENEASIFKNWSAHYPKPKQPSNPIYLDTNSTFYNMYYSHDMDLDLLLLQPILLGDDHDVRTPYLENLYSIMCQVQNWSTSGKSIFFSRQIAGSESHRKEIKSLTGQLGTLRLEKEEIENSHRERLSSLKQLDANIRQKKEAYDQVSKDLQDKTQHLELNIRQLTAKSGELRDIDAAISEKHSKLTELDNKLAQRNSALAKTQEVQPSARDVTQSYTGHASHMPAPADAKVSNNQQLEDTSKIQALQTPDMSDLSDIAIYGAALNGDMQTPRVPNTASQGDFSRPEAESSRQPQPNVQNGSSSGLLDLKEKELELQRRERALLDRERNVSGSSHPSMNDGYNEYEQNGHYQSHVNTQVNNQNGGSNQVNPNYNQVNPNYNNMNPNYNNMNPNYNNMNGGYRQSYSLTGTNPYMDGGPQEAFQGNGPHNMAPNMRNNQRFHHGAQGQQYNQMPPQASRRGSQGNMQNLAYQQQIPGVNPQQQRFNGQPQMQGMPSKQQGSQHFMMNQGSQGNIGGFPPKKPNRRSAFPDQTLNIDYGGRGGMAMTNAVAKPRNGAHTSPNLSQQRKSTMGFPQPQPSNPASGNQLLRPPAQNGSSNSSGSGQNTPNSTTPEPFNEVRMEVPKTMPAGAPLGAIASDSPKEKKKRGFLKKS